MVVMDIFKEILERFPEESNKEFKNNDFASKMRNELNNEFSFNISNILNKYGIPSEDYDEKIISGIGNWFSVVICEIKNKNISSFNNSSFFISYFLDPSLNGVYLSLIHSWHKFSGKKRVVVKDIVENLANSINNDDIPLGFEKLDLNIANGQRMWADINDVTILSKFYSLDDFNKSSFQWDFEQDLISLISIYENLVPIYNNLTMEFNETKVYTDFKEILKRFSEENKKPFKNNSLAKKMRFEFTNDFKDLILELTNGNPLYDAKISPGLGGWIKYPWAGVSNYKVAKTYEEGLTFSYKFKGSKIILGFSLGINKTSKILREKQGKLIISEIKKNFTEFYGSCEIDTDYGGNFIYKSFSFEDLNPKLIKEDLSQMIEIYEFLIPIYLNFSNEDSINKITDNNFKEANLDKVISVEDKNIWRIAPGERNIAEEVWELFKTEGYVGIGSFRTDDEDTNYLNFKTQEDIKNYLLQFYEDDAKIKAPGMIWNFVHNIKIGDLIVVNIGRSDLVGIGIITSDFISQTDNKSKNKYKLNHIRKVKWLITERIIIENNFFPRMTLSQVDTKHWNDIVSSYSKNNSEFKTKLLNYLYLSCKKDYLKSEDGTNHLKAYNLESELIKTNYESIILRENNGDYIADDIWHKLISPKGSIFAPYSNSKELFKKRYNYSEEILDQIAILFFNTIKNIIDNDADFNYQKYILSNFVNNDLSKGFKTGLITPTLYLLDNDFLAINKKTIDSFKFLSLFLKTSGDITNELLDYVDNNIKLHKFLVELSEEVPELGDFKNFDSFCHWLCTSDLGFYARDKGLPLIGFEDINSSETFDESKLLNINLNPNLIDTNLKINDDLLYRLCGALNAKKHIILDGAPGTGKTELAIDLSESAVNENFIDGYVLTTATSDWTTFDTIGGLMPDEEGKLYFHEGKFLEAIHNNHWLIIDEINRSDIDKAFGQLFTVLSGQTVDLPYKYKNGESIKIAKSEGNLSYFEEKSATYYIGKNWRILATMNVFDKDSLFDLSYAFMRRFTFINVGLPKNNEFEDLIDEFADNCEGDIDGIYLDQLKYLLELNQFRQLGPAIFKDMVEYIKCRTDLDDSYDIMGETILSYVIPQFEGLSLDKLKTIYNFFVEKELISEDIKLKLNEFAGIDLV